MISLGLVFRFALLALLLGAATFLHAAQVVKVAAAVFPPYIEKEGPDATGAVKIELISLMNAFQNKYRFELVESTAVRRFSDFDQGLYDVSCFDNLAWGWGDRPVDASPVYLRGSEVYVAQAKPGRDQTYFADLTNKRMIGMRGYHYGFAKFNADPKYLEANFRMALTQTNEMTLRFLLLDRGDVAVVTEAFLPDYFARNPQNKGQLLISTRKDQTYAHSCIVRRGTQPGAAEIGRLLEQMHRKGALKSLWQKYGAERRPALP